MRKILFSLMFVMVCTLPLIGEGATYYVSTSGDDISGDGSYNSPFATYSHAYLNSNNGDKIYVLGGTYTINSNVDIVGTDNVIFKNYNILETYHS